MSDSMDPLASVPDEVALGILAHLDAPSLSASGLVSKKWRLFSVDPILWRTLCFRELASRSVKHAEDLSALQLLHLHVAPKLLPSKLEALTNGRPETCCEWRFLYVAGKACPLPARGGIMNLFGRRKPQDAPSPRDRLNETVELLEKRERHLEEKVKQATETARDRAQARNRRAAVQCLKRRRMYEQQLERVMTSRMSLEMQILALDATAMPCSFNRVMREWRQPTVGEIDDVMDGLHEPPVELGGILAPPPWDAITDAELEEELEALLTDGFPDAPQGGAQTLDAPRPRGDAPADSVSRARGETDEERELRELEESMMA